VLHLEVGQPSTGAPVLVKEAAVKALRGDKLGYTEAFGIRPLRERLAQVKKNSKVFSIVTFYSKKISTDL